MTIPNLLIIGDLKAGSTSLFEYLRQHPQVYFPKIKELRYFAYDKENPYHVRAKSYRVKTFRDYLSYFEESGDAKAIGEASPNYLRSPGAAARIKAKIPKVRLIACLRNPADRLHSAYMMSYRAKSTKKPFDEQLFGGDAAWIKANFYWLDLKRYFDLFAADQIKIILFDDLKASRPSVVKELYEFLKVDETFLPDLKIHNVGGIPQNRLLYSSLVGGKNLLKRFINPSAAMRQIWETVKRNSLQRVQIDPQIRKKIIEICKDDIYRTQDLIGRDLSIWLS